MWCPAKTGWSPGSGSGTFLELREVTVTFHKTTNATDKAEYVAMVAMVTRVTMVMVAMVTFGASVVGCTVSTATPPRHVTRVARVTRQAYVTLCTG